MEQQTIDDGVAYVQAAKAKWCIGILLKLGEQRSQGLSLSLRRANDHLARDIPNDILHRWFHRDLDKQEEYLRGYGVNHNPLGSAHHDSAWSKDDLDGRRNYVIGLMSDLMSDLRDTYLS